MAIKDILRINCKSTATADNTVTMIFYTNEKRMNDLLILVENQILNHIYHKNNMLVNYLSFHHGFYHCLCYYC